MDTERTAGEILEAEGWIRQEALKHAIAIAYAGEDAAVVIGRAGAFHDFLTGKSAGQK